MTLENPTDAVMMLLKKHLFHERHNALSGPCVISAKR